MKQTERARILNFSQANDERGCMAIAQAGKEIPFIIKRIFYTYNMQGDAIRGQHANRYSNFILVNVVGSCEIKVDYGNETEIFVLDKPYQGLYIPNMVWKDMYDFSPDSVQLVLASEKYSAEEYIRNYEEYIAEVCG